jgi:hypothetical protein
MVVHWRAICMAVERSAPLRAHAAAVQQHGCKWRLRSCGVGMAD